MRLYSMAASLVAVSENFARRYPTDARAAGATVTDAWDVLGRLLKGGHLVAGRLAAAFRNAGAARIADEIVTTVTMMMTMMAMVTPPPAGGRGLPLFHDEHHKESGVAPDGQSSFARSDCLVLMLICEMLCIVGCPVPTWRPVCTPIQKTHDHERCYRQGLLSMDPAAHGQPMAKTRLQARGKRNAAPTRPSSRARPITEETLRRLRTLAKALDGVSNEATTVAAIARSELARIWRPARDGVCDYRTLQCRNEARRPCEGRQLNSSLCPP